MFSLQLCGYHMPLAYVFVPVVFVAFNGINRWWCNVCSGRPRRISLCENFSPLFCFAIWFSVWPFSVTASSCWTTHTLRCVKTAYRAKQSDWLAYPSEEKRIREAVLSLRMGAPSLDWVRVCVRVCEGCTQVHLPWAYADSEVKWGKQEKPLWL